MRKILATAGLVFGLTVSTAFAQMGGGSGGMGGQQQSQQMMGQDMMREMAGMMRQMNDTMQKMSHVMGHQTVTDHMKMQNMGKMMHEMAGQMNDLGTLMEKGKMDEVAIKQMHEKIMSMNKRLDEIKKGSQ